MPNALASRLTREHSQELLRLERAELAKLAKLYEEARLELLGRLHALGEASKLDTFTAQSLRATLAQVQAGVAAMQAKLAGQHEQAIQSAAQDGALQTLDEIAFFERTRDFRGSAFGRIQTAALRSVSKHQGLLLHRFEASIQAYGQGMIGDIQRRLGVHIVQRSKWADMATDVAGRLYAHGVKGSQWKAERIVRTELVHALNVGHHAALETVQAERLPDLQKQWDSVLDKRTSDVCRSLDGQIRGVNETWSYGGRVIAHPPAIPNCRSRVTPYRAAWAQIGDDEDEGPSAVEIQARRDAAKVSIVPKGDPTPPATAKEVDAAKLAYRKLVLESPAEKAAIDAAAIVLRKKLIGFHKAKLSGQALADAVSTDAQKVIDAAQAALAKARSAAAKDLAFYRKSLAEAYAQAGGTFPDDHVSAYITRAKHFAKLDGLSGDQFDEFVTLSLSEAKDNAVAAFEGKQAAIGLRVEQAKAGYSKAVLEGGDLVAAEKELLNALGAQGRLAGLKGDAFKAHVDAGLVAAKQAATEAKTAAAVAAEVEKAAPLVELVLHPGKFGSDEVLDAALKLKGFEHLDAVAEKLGHAPKAVRGEIQATLGAEIEGLIGKQAQALVKNAALKIDTGEHGKLLAKLEEVAKAYDPAAVTELLDEAKKEASQLLAAWKTESEKLLHAKKAYVEKLLEIHTAPPDSTAHAGLELQHLKSQTAKTASLYGGKVPDDGKLLDTGDFWKSTWVDASKDVWDADAIHKAGLRIADLAAKGEDALFAGDADDIIAAKTLILAYDDLAETTKLFGGETPDLHLEDAQKLLALKDEPLPHYIVRQQLKTSTKPIDPAQIVAEYEGGLTDAINAIGDAAAGNATPADIDQALAAAYQKAQVWGEKVHGIKGLSAENAKAHAENLIQVYVESVKQSTSSSYIASLVQKHQAGTPLEFSEAISLLRSPPPVRLLVEKQFGLSTTVIEEARDFAAELLTEGQTAYAKLLSGIDAKVAKSSIAKLQAKGLKAAEDDLAALKSAAANVSKVSEAVGETPWLTTQSGAPEKVTLPDGSKAKKIAGSSGSNPGGFYQVEGSGETYFIKFPKSVGQVGAEKVSADLGELMGLAKKNYQTFAVGEKHVAIASPKIKFSELGGSKLAGWKNQDELARQFVHAAWTRNWDVVGLGFDNLVEANGKLLVVDYGGSLLWRAQGGLKPGGMPKVVEELTSLRKAGTNQQTAAAFGHLTDEKLAQTIKATLSQLDDDAIEQIVATGKFTAEDRVAITKGLLERKEWLDEWADTVLGKSAATKTPEEIAKSVLGPLPNDPDAALVFKAGSGGASPDSLRQTYKAALNGDVTAQAKIGRRLWGGTPALEANEDIAARFLIAAWKKNADVVRTELQGSAWADAMKPVLDVLEQHGAKIATPEQLQIKLAQAKKAAEIAAKKAAEEAAVKAAAAKAKAAAAKAEFEKKHAVYLAEKAAYGEKLAAWKAQVEKIKGKAETATGAPTAAYQKKLNKWAAELSKWSKGGEVEYRDIRGKARDAVERWSIIQRDTAADLQRIQASLDPLEAKKKAGDYLSWSERNALKHLRAEKAAKQAELRNELARYRKDIEQLAERAAILPPKPVAPKAPPGLGGKARPESVHVNQNPTANPNAGHPAWQSRRAELQRIGQDLGWDPSQTAAEIKKIEAAIGRWKGAAQPARTAQKLLHDGLTDAEILAKGVSSYALEDAKAFNGELWQRASGWEGELWRGERWVDNASQPGGRSKAQNIAWLKDFLENNDEWTWPYSAGWSTNNGFQGAGYGGGMPIQYHIVGRSNAKSFMHYGGYDSERELQTPAGVKWKILGYKWQGESVRIDLAEIFEDGTTGVD